MAGLSESELHAKIIESLAKGEDPKPFVKDWCIPGCVEYKEMLGRCERALRIVS